MRKIYLRNFYRDDKIVEYNMGIRNVLDLSIEESKYVDSTGNINGFYSYIDKHFLALYCMDNKLYLRLNNNEYCITDEYEINITGRFLILGLGKKTFKLYKNHRIVEKIRYSDPVLGTFIRYDPFPSAYDERHLDMFYWLKWVINSEENRRVMTMIEKERVERPD